MSFTANLHGHFADDAKNVQALEVVRAAARELDALADRDAGDTFGGSFSGPTIADDLTAGTYVSSVSFPEA